MQAELFDLQGPVQVLCRLHNQGDSNSDGEVVAQQDCPVNTCDIKCMHAAKFALGLGFGFPS